MSIPDKITAIPEHQLSDELEPGGRFHANGFEFRLLYKTPERYIVEEIADNRAFHRLSQKVNELEERIEELEEG